MSAAQNIVSEPTQTAAGTRSPTETDAELKRGALWNTVALLASNFRSIFTFLVARLLGPAALGLFSVAWASTDLVSKLGVFGLDDTITTFVARADAANDRARGRRLFRLTLLLALAQSTGVALILIVILQFFGSRLSLRPEMIMALSIMMCALPAVALYRISNSVSRGMKVMQHDVYSRGLTDSTATTLAFLLALSIGLKNSAPPLAAVVGMTACGIVALVLAARLFRRVSAEPGTGTEAGELLAYAAPTSIHQFLTAFILRLDVIMLAWFIGRAPGVTLGTVGVYGAVIDIASASRKLNQTFNPIFAPVVAGMTAQGEQENASATYGRIAQWMLWALLPIVAVTLLAGEAILSIYGPAFRQGNVWLAIITIACATNAFISLGEIVIMVQRPRLNLFNSVITCAIAIAANLWLIPRYGVTGAAFGILLPYTVQGLLRFGVLRFVFGWKSPWRAIKPPILAAFFAIPLALVLRLCWSGLISQIAAALTFLVIFAALWGYHLRRREPAWP